MVSSDEFQHGSSAAMPAAGSSADIDPGASASQSLPDPMLGSVLHDRYRIVSKLGEGGMGVVYAAEHVRINDRLAVKLLRKEIVSNEEAVARFEQEARSASSIKHKNIIRISDFGELSDGRIFLCMELLDGAPLNDMLEEGGLPHDRLLNILIQTGHGLAAAHRADIVHRDMKPENIFVTRDENGADVPKLLDFGIAKVSGNDGQNNLTRTGTIFGTPFYMAPEQALGQGVDARADVYAMGVIMYECFAGSVPFQGDSFMGILTQHITAEPESVAARAAAAGRVLPPGMEEIIVRAMAKDPDDRYQTMDDLVQALVRVYRGVAGAGMSGYMQAHVPGPSSGAMPAYDPGIIPGVTHQSPGAPSMPPPGLPGGGAPPSGPYPHPHSGPGSAGHSAPTPMPATGDSFSDLHVPKKSGKGAFIAALLLILAVGGAIAAFVVMSGSSEDGSAAASTDDTDTDEDGTGDDGTGDEDGTGDDDDDGSGGTVADGTGDDDTVEGDDDDDGTGGTVEATDPVPVVETLTFKVMVDSKPAGAVVWNGDKIVDKAPVVIEVKEGEPLDLVLKRSGYRDKDVTIDGKKKKVIVRMRRKHRGGGGHHNNNNGNSGNRGDDDDDDTGSKPDPFDPASDLE